MPRFVVVSTEDSGPTPVTTLRRIVVWIDEYVRIVRVQTQTTVNETILTGVADASAKLATNYRMAIGFVIMLVVSIVALILGHCIARMSQRRQLVQLKKFL